LPLVPVVRTLVLLYFWFACVVLSLYLDACIILYDAECLCRVQDIDIFTFDDT